MKRPRNIYNLSVLLSLIIFMLGCPPSKKEAPEEAPQEEGQAVDGRGYDPLELPQDKQIVPEKISQTGAITGTSPVSTSDTLDLDTTTMAYVTPPVELDTLNNQVFRIQLFTSKLYSEAKHEVLVAEEIFDQPVYLDYEVPYFKVRVGNFASRVAAENYQQTARTAGYTNAWTVVVNINVEETQPLYEDVSRMILDKGIPDTMETIIEDTIPEEEENDGGGQH
jgi:hypothetical protein